MSTHASFRVPAALARVPALAALGAMALCATIWALPAAAEPVRVVASIKPVHSLASGVMAGIGEPHLIVRGSGAPHTYGLAPSDAEALEKARVVFWVGPTLEAFLARALGNLSRGATVVALAQSPGVKRLPLREGGGFEAHADDDDHDRADDKHANDHDKKPGKTAKTEGGGHRHGEIDSHVWLNTENAIAMVKTIERTLAKADPGNAPRYAANAADVVSRLQALTNDIRLGLRPVAKRPFVVFHDGYQYFEKQFGLSTVGAITLSPETQPGARRIRDIRDKIRALGANCIFAEPQFDSRIVRSIADATGIRTGVLDPLGATLADGPQLYFELMRQNAAAIKDCLSPAS
ncbi:MAG: zinc ABC transporter substrate-binding protein [Proteobacteria bacterium]|nr:zinc ABC transporter substrate-binding protein [Pseudomonadota bacterium]